MEIQVSRARGQACELHFLKSHILVASAIASLLPVSPYNWNTWAAPLVPSPSQCRTFLAMLSSSSSLPGEQERGAGVLPEVQGSVGWWAGHGVKAFCDKLLWSPFCPAGLSPVLPDVFWWGVGHRTVFPTLRCAVPKASCYQLQWPLYCILRHLQSHYIPPSRHCDIPRANPQHVPTGDSSGNFCSPGGRCPNPANNFRSRIPVLRVTCREIHSKIHASVCTTVLLRVFFPLDASLQ